MRRRCRRLPQNDPPEERHQRPDDPAPDSRRVLKLETADGIEHLLAIGAGGLDEQRMPGKGDDTDANRFGLTSD